MVHLVQRDNDGVEEALAVRIVDEALKFVAAATRATGRRLRPSKLVELGWHALILRTAVYRELCTAGGRFVDHRPEGPDTLRRHADTLTHTMDAIREAGYEPDQYLWGRSSGHLGFAPGCETSRRASTPRLPAWIRGDSDGGSRNGRASERRVRRVLLA
ncbi:hypothetical protein SLAV_07545 [Streptomyces lavendulae subsp. lavendulae]|uniref:Uncharacterized protein n=1 Tax=Streptomyces lavendulae subsp. lavendulae TaxID=58340 RepID=A0A2K8P9I5_STRLA|nr:hypothetical protein [Streptomyces lavendulae]ATZ23412.1 hypothetical protein SLAV_07545 [Streptomyces lavendulae subsp. lavendulae]QUQ53243.1 hypothetical protein SLLC_05565 [Streptomyces lavendulae subsp. lavendulae]